MEDIVIVAAARTAVGKFGGTLGGTPATELGAVVIKSVLEDIKISTIFYGVIPFIITDIIRLIILVAFPILATWLPSHM